MSQHFSVEDLDLKKNAYLENGHLEHHKKSKITAKIIKFSLETLVIPKKIRLWRPKNSLPDRF